MSRSKLQTIAVLTLFAAGPVAQAELASAPFDGNQSRRRPFVGDFSSLHESDVSASLDLTVDQTPQIQTLNFSEALQEEGLGAEDWVALPTRVAAHGWQILPDGLLYHSYIAGEKEPRFASQWLWEKDRGRIWEAAVGGRWGLVRKGTYGTNAEGFQFDVEGAGLVRIDPESEDDLEAADFRAGFIGTWRQGAWRWKTGYYHLSSHVGDEFLIKNPTFDRRNYVRDALLFGAMYNINLDLAVYGEYAYAANSNGGAEPGEIQFGVEYSPMLPMWRRGAPFAAINAHLREEYNFGGSVNVLAGWQWRGMESSRTFRFGFQHYNGPSMQYSFVNRYESLTGMGLWFDF